MKSKYLLLLLFLFSFTMITAQGLTNPSTLGSYEQNQEMQITNYCEVGNCTFMNLTSIEYPNGTVIYPDSSMIKNGQVFSYQYIPTLLGEYKFITCGDMGNLICDKDKFLVTPNGNSGTDNLVFYIILLILLYTLTFIFFFNRIPSFTALSGMALGSFGLYITTNGFIIFQDWITTYLSYITMGIGFGLGLWALIEWIQEL